MKSVVKPRVLRPGERIAPKQQQNWDWRAASNFVFGGSGGGLLLFAVIALLLGADVRLPVFVGMALIGIGLTCVWFEIGRPWRALNVYRHLATSWMTREAAVAPLLFACGVLYLVGAGSLFAGLAGLLGLVFVYSQARILGADKGIPAWRHPRCRPLVVATGLAEGAGLLAAVTPWLLPSATRTVAILFGALLVARLVLWKRYTAGLRADGAPDGSLNALAAIDPRFVAIGNALPLLFAAAGAVGAAELLLPAAGLCAVGGGWWLKATLVRRAAFTQGFALKHLPVRGRASPAVGSVTKPGWGGAA